MEAEHETGGAWRRQEGRNGPDVEPPLDDVGVQGAHMLTHPPEGTQGLQRTALEIENRHGDPDGSEIELKAQGWSESISD